MNLGNGFRYRFEGLRDFGDLEKAMEKMHQAVRLTPEKNIKMPGFLSNLGFGYVKLFKHLGKFKDLERAIEIMKPAVQLTPDGHLQRQGTLSNLGNTYFLSWDCQHKPSHLFSAR